MENKNPNQIPEEEDSLFRIDYKKLISDVIKLWWLFVITLLIAFVGIKFYHRYAVPVYSSTISVIVDELGAAQASSQNSMIDGFMLSPAMRNIDNQVAVLGSWTVVRRAVEKMGIYVSYYQHGRISTHELYGRNNPLCVVMDSTQYQPINVPFSILVIDSAHYRLKVETEGMTLYNYATGSTSGIGKEIIWENEFAFGEPVVTPWCAFTLHRIGQLNQPEYSFRFHNPMELVARMKNSMSIIRDEKSSSSVVSIVKNGTCVAKDLDFLNTIAKMFIDDNLNQKNLMAENTIRFIDEQLRFLGDTLMDIGTQLSSFRTMHGLQQSVSAKGSSLFSEMQEYEKNIQKARIELAYYEYLKRYFSSDSVLAGVIAPAIYETQSPVIETQINEIVKLNSEKQAYQDTYGMPVNPATKEILAKLHISRNTLLRSIESQKAMVQGTINDNTAKYETLRREMNSLPETERIYLGIDRKFSLNNDVYNFLLRKRSESQIQKASSTSDHKILDPAMSLGCISPNVKRNQTMAFALAIILPLGFILLRQILDGKIRTEDDIQHITSLPIVGQIQNNYKDSPMVVLEYPKSMLSEMFRRMRTRLDFMTVSATDGTPVIGVSSTMSGDGKTFCSVNIASVYAISGKRTVCVGFDMRRPGMSSLLKLEGHLGLSNYLAGGCQLNDIIVNFADNLDVIPAGDIPPNPAELIQSPTCTSLMETLKRTYDVIVLDTPPMGLVSDAYVLAKYMTTLVFIVRQDYTLREPFGNTVSSFEAEGFRNVALVFNDMNSKNSRYGYGYGYGRYGKYGKYGKGYGGKYGYGYSDHAHGYYSD